MKPNTVAQQSGVEQRHVNPRNPEQHPKSETPQADAYVVVNIEARHAAAGISSLGQSPRVHRAASTLSSIIVSISFSTTFSAKPGVV